MTFQVFADVAVDCSFKDCGFNELLDQVQAILSFIVVLALLAATVLIVWTGVRYVHASAKGSYEGMNLAKQTGWGIVFGLFLILGAYLIVEVVFNIFGYKEGSPFELPVGTVVTVEEETNKTNAEDCTTTDTPSGIKVNCGDNVFSGEETEEEPNITVEDCTITDTPGGGIIFDCDNVFSGEETEEEPNITVEDCTITDTPGEGIIFDCESIFLEEETEEERVLQDTQEFTPSIIGPQDILAEEREQEAKRLLEEEKQQLELKALAKLLVVDEKLLDMAIDKCKEGTEEDFSCEHDVEIHYYKEICHKLYEIKNGKKFSGRIAFQMHQLGGPANIDCKYYPF